MMFFVFMPAQEKRLLELFLDRRERSPHAIELEIRTPA
jgi:hypothetical protein